MRIVIIGGGTAGSEAAWRLRQLDKTAEITVLEKGGHTQYSPCSLPYVLAGEIKNFNDIFLFKKQYYGYNKINLLNNAAAKKIDRAKKTVEYERRGRAETIGYDRLIIALGSRFAAPDIPGLDEGSYFTFKNIEDAKAVHGAVKQDERAVIIGAGYIGVELAHALRARGLAVVLLEALDRILPAMFDKEIAVKITAAMAEAGVKTEAGIKITKLAPGRVKTADREIGFDHLFVCCGLKPDTALASEAGLSCERGICVDEYGRTNDKNIYAVGDAAESVNLIDGQKTLSRLATTAVRQAKVAAQNILGAKIKNEPVLSTSISGFGELLFGSSGATEEYCRQRGIETVSALYNGKSRAEYHPAAREIAVKIVARQDGKMVGCQILGYEEVAGRLNMAALAIKQGLTIDEFIKSETAYNPAISPIFEPLTVAAEICRKKLNAK